MKIVNREIVDSHKSNHSDTKWYIDEVRKTKNIYTIRGWLYNVNSSISTVKIGEDNFDWNEVSHPRPDVEDVYGNSDKGNIGFEVYIDDTNLDKEVSVKFKEDERYHHLGNLTRFFTEQPSTTSNSDKGGRAGIETQTQAISKPKRQGSKGSSYEVVEDTPTDAPEVDDSVVSEINPSAKRELIVVDNFYTNPYNVRKYAMENMNFVGQSDFYRGNRTDDTFIVDGTKEKFEELLGKKIINWENGNGLFQWCPGDTPIVYHVDQQEYAAIIFLTPNAPLNSGTKTFRSKITGATHFDGDNLNESNKKYLDTFSGYGDSLSFYESVSFEEVDSVANVYNRLVIWNATSIHAASNYFGDIIDNSRFFQLFFFDVE